MKIRLTTKERIIFLHSMVWVAIILSTLLFQPDTKDGISLFGFQKYFRQINTIQSILFVGFFYLNAYVLIPRLLLQKKIAAYFFLSLVILIIYSLLFQKGIEHYVNFRSGRNPLTPASKFPLQFIIFPYVFNTLISIIYRYIIDGVKKEKLNNEKERESLKTELQFLKSQISPHFIFNVLNGIVYLLKNNPALAEKIVLTLSELIRYNIYDAKSTPSNLDKEVTYIKNYIELNKMRFGESLNIKLEIFGDISNYLIEPLLLVPFIENAIKHGLTNNKDYPTIIKVKMEAGTLDFYVKNKMNRTNEKYMDDDSGIGIKNIKRRLELLYPDTSLLVIEEVDDFFVVNLKMTLKSIKYDKLYSYR